MPRPSARHPADLLALLAMVFPTLGAWVYFDLLAGREVARSAYIASKGMQLALPLAWIVLAVSRPGLRGGWRGIAWGLGSGGLLAAGVLALYRGGLAASPLAAEATPLIRAKLADFRLDSPLAYLAFAAVLAVAHSLFEELYWRWFVFQRLGAWLPPGAAVALSSLAFAAHHTIVVASFAPPGQRLAITVAATLAIAAAGALWCWLLARGGSLLSPWLSHLLVDAALMAVGYDLLWG